MSISKIQKAIDNVHRQIALQTDQSNKYSRGLAYEGYLGGYVDALMDAIAIIRKVPTSHKNRRYWEEE